MVRNEDATWGRVNGTGDVRPISVNTGDRSCTRKDVQKLDCVGAGHTLAPPGEELRGQSGTRMTGSCWVRVQVRDCWIVGRSRCVPTSATSAFSIPIWEITTFVML